MLPACNDVRVLSRLSRGQRVVLVVAWGAVLTLVGMYVASGWSIFGYAESVTVPHSPVGYEPLNAYPVFPSRFDLTALECFFVWLGLVLLWVIGALLALRTPRIPAPPTTG